MSKLYRKIIAVYENHAEHINELCSEHRISEVKPGST